MRLPVSRLLTTTKSRSDPQQGEAQASLSPMPAIQRSKYLCKVSLPGKTVEQVVIDAYSASSAKQILTNKYPKARGILVLKTI